MEFKVSSSKAQGVKKLRAIFPHGWQENPGTDVPDAVLIDALQGLIGFKDGTGADCALRTSYLARRYIENSPCPLVVLCFDQYKNVPIAKAAEQALRAKSVHKAQEAKDALEEHSEPGYRELPKPGIWEDRVVPYDFNEGLQDRKGYRPDVIRFLCHQWISSPDPKIRLVPNSGCSIMIIGHCLESEDILKLTDNDDWQKLGLEPGDDPEEIPIIIEEGGMNLRFDRNLQHRIGEGEMQFFHLIEQLKLTRPLLVSTDSDVLFLCLTYLRTRVNDIPDRECYILWRYDSRQPSQLFCHVNLLAEAICSGKIDVNALKRSKRKGTDISHVIRNWTSQEDPIMQIIAAQALAGTDYTQGMLKVTHEAVFEALVLASTRIGPLIRDLKESIVSPQGYLRLLLVSWIQARLPNFPLVPNISKTSKDDNDSDMDIDDNPLVLEAWKKHMMNAWEDSQRFEARYRLPHPIDDNKHYTNRILRWAYYLNMQFQVGQAVLNLEEPGQWGYGPLDEEITRDNIYPLLEE